MLSHEITAQTRRYTVEYRESVKSRKVKIGTLVVGSEYEADKYFRETYPTRVVVLICLESEYEVLKAAQTDQA